MTKTKQPQTQYHATFELDPSGQWLVELDEIPEVHTFGRTLGKAREYLLDALALWLDEPVEAVKHLVEFGKPTLPIDIQKTVDMALAGREIADAATQTAAALTAQASVELVTGARLSMRDAADVLGLSHQRVQQLVAGSHVVDPHRADLSGPAVDSLAKSLRQFLPGGSKEDLGALATLVAFALGVAWTRSK
jgi:predicted RNase H-like HicB family nuclease